MKSIQKYQNQPISIMISNQHEASCLIFQYNNSTFEILAYAKEEITANIDSENLFHDNFSDLHYLQCRALSILDYTEKLCKKKTELMIIPLDAKYINSTIIKSNISQDHSQRINKRTISTLIKNSLQYLMR